MVFQCQSGEFQRKTMSLQVKQLKASDGAQHLAERYTTWGHDSH